MSDSDNQKKKETEANDKSVDCCGCRCSKGEIASFLRHLASFFDKKK